MQSGADFTNNSSCKMKVERCFIVVRYGQIRIWQHDQTFNKCNSTTNHASSSYRAWCGRTRKRNLWRWDLNYTCGTLWSHEVLALKFTLSALLRDSLFLNPFTVVADMTRFTSAHCSFWEVLFEVFVTAYGVWVDERLRVLMVSLARSNKSEYVVRLLP